MGCGTSSVQVKPSESPTNSKPASPTNTHATRENAQATENAQESATSAQASSTNAQATVIPVPYSTNSETDDYDSGNESDADTMLRRKQGIGCKFGVQYHTTCTCSTCTSGCASRYISML
jgi:hypothetical protein